MKKKSLLFWFVAFVCAALIFTGCPPEPDDDTKETVETWLTAGSVFQLVTVDGNRARLKVKNGADFGDAKLYDVPAAPLDVLKAVYEPNAPGSAADSMETGKTAVAYNATLSGEVLPLFQFTTGTVSNAVTIDKVEITGTALPGDNNEAYNANNLIVIDIGKPGVVNTGLPTFYIPHQELGNGTDDYAHIRLRVNSGAELVLLADNDEYISQGEGHPGDPGHFNGGCVEVMSGGKLRDGAFEGFPLGADAVILNRYGSYLSVGPEPGSADATNTTNGTNNSYNLYYSGYLLGPADASPRIEWDATGNTAASYLEVRPGEIATDAKLTAKKSLGLIYSVWFVGGAHLTVDAASETAVVFAQGNTTIHGIMANETASQSFDFYGCDTTRVGNDNPFITINAGNLIDGRFLSSTASDKFDSTVSATNSAVKIGFKTTPSGSAVDYGYSTGISGYILEDLSTNQNQN